MLVRDDPAAPETIVPRVLAACPDTDDRGEPWRWSVRLVPADVEAGVPEVVVDVDPEHVRYRSTTHRDGETVDLHRSSGEEVVVVPVVGQCLVADATGPWRRWLAPGDVFVGEGERAESLRVTMAPGRGELVVVTLAPTAGQPLRWVP